MIAGSSFPYIEFYPKPVQAQAAQIDIDPQRIGLRYPVAVGLIGDVRKTLNALLPKLQYRQDRPFLEKMQTGAVAWKELLAQHGMPQDKPMKPQVVAHELNNLLRDDAIISTDSGTITTWAARHLVIRGDMMFFCSGNLASMACGLPYAIAAALAYPQRQVVCFIGDGGLTMLMAELATCVKYGLDIKIVVKKTTRLVKSSDFVTVARGFGLNAYMIDEPANCTQFLQQALSTTGPTLIEAVVDPHEPPMPPKIDLEQAAHLVESLARGTPERGRIALTIASDTIRELI